MKLWICTSTDGSFFWWSTDIAEAHQEAHEHFGNNISFSAREATQEEFNNYLECLR